MSRPTVREAAQTTIDSRTPRSGSSSSAARSPAARKGSSARTSPATIPAAVPFLLVAEPWRALRLSNLFLVGMLFVVGFQWGKHAYVSRWGAGLAFLAVGLVLVGVAIALGG